MENENTTQDDALQLFNKVIESNQENIVASQGMLIAIANFEKLTELEQERRKKFAESVPSDLQIRLVDEHFDLIKSWDQKMLKSKNLHFLLLGSVAASLLTMLLSVYFTQNWYSESIKAKSELRQEILNEIEKDGKEIYKVGEVQQLEHNTEMMNKWMQKNPKDAEKFLRFKDGYESR